jgi:Sugar-transfer associated ATP-grasp
MCILRHNTMALDSINGADAMPALQAEIVSPLEGGKVLSNIGAGAVGVGAFARHCYKSLKMFRSANHPPIKAAFYPGLREATVIIVIGWLLFDAGPSVKRATGKSIFQQAREMWRLWFDQTIDPPSYYALELYRPDNLVDADSFLTRYETKNGLLKALNTARQNPRDKNEMNDKSFFAICCQELGLPHARVIGEITNGSASWAIQPEQIRFDLFCKRQRGMGAEGCLTFRFIDENRFEAEDGELADLDGVIKRVSMVSGDRSMLIQQWLKNHDGLCDLAKDSLLTIRVVTCMNEDDQPEACLAMLRLLVILEPDWQYLPDGEYAAPIDLKTGRLGKFAGDSMSTSPLRYDNHPANNARIVGRVMPEWPSIIALAVKAQSAFPHRLMIGWDIALTPDGPVLLEGNVNFDVMFLQRVHDAPVSHSRFGVLLQHHLESLVERRAH